MGVHRRTPPSQLGRIEISDRRTSGFALAARCSGGVLELCPGIGDRPGDDDLLLRGRLVRNVAQQGHQYGETLARAEHVEGGGGQRRGLCVGSAEPFDQRGADVAVVEVPLGQGVHRRVGPVRVQAGEQESTRLGGRQ